MSTIKIVVVVVVVVETLHITPLFKSFFAVKAAFIKTSSFLIFQCRSCS